MTTSVVDLQQVEPGVVQLTLQDRTHKNAFSPALMAGLREGFAQIKADARQKVLILTGYDSYFCSGGTQEALLSLHAGAATFADSGLYGLPIDCDIPVIAAMQGHGIGGGLVFGLAADAVILSRESLYAANFMRYGFTPGMGATYLLPHRLGPALAAEMLLSARGYRGAELEQRGVPFSVVRRDEVLERARLLARDMAEKPRAALVTLKRHLVAGTRAQLPGIIAQELAMHAATIHEPEVDARIRTQFGRG